MTTETDLRFPEGPIYWRPWVGLAEWAVRTHAVVWILVLINVGSAVPGYLFWYGDALLRAPWYLWLFVPDSPLSVTFMGAALVAFHYGWRWDLLGLVATGACMKYGLWTDFVWLTNYLSGGEYHFTAILMSITHFGMFVEGLVLSGLLHFRPLPVLVASLYLIVNDVVDYVLGYHPPLPNRGDLDAITRFSVAETAVIVVLWIALAAVAYRRTRTAPSTENAR